MWVKSSSATTNGIELWLHDTQGNGSVGTTVSPGTGWQQISTAFTATSIGKLRIHLIQLAGTAAETTYWDDITVTPLPPNGGFETGSLTPWTIAGGNAAIGTTGHSGAYGATLGGTTTQSWIFQDVSGLIPGLPYQVTVWVKSSSSSTNGVELWVHDTQGNGANSAVISPGTGWQQMTVSFTATSTGKLRIHLVQGAGTSESTYWDDVVVTPIPPANGGFELGTVTPWILQTGTAAISTVAPHSGTYDLSMAPTNSTDLVYQDVYGLIPGQTYTVSAWVRSSSSGTGAVALGIHDTLGNGYVSSSFTPQTTWQKFSQAYTVTSNGAMRIHLYEQAGPETAYWDDITVQRTISANNTATTNATTATSSSGTATRSYVIGANTRIAAGSSTDPVKSVKQVPPIPKDTMTAKGSSADPVLPVSKTSPPKE